MGISKKSGSSSFSRRWTHSELHCGDRDPSSQECDKNVAAVIRLGCEFLAVGVETSSWTKKPKTTLSAWTSTTSSTTIWCLGCGSQKDMGQQRSSSEVSEATCEDSWSFGGHVTNIRRVLGGGWTWQWFSHYGGVGANQVSWDGQSSRSQSWTSSTTRWWSTTWWRTTSWATSWEPWVWTEHPWRWCTGTGGGLGVWGHAKTGGRYNGGGTTRDGRTCNRSSMAFTTITTTTTTSTRQTTTSCAGFDELRIQTMQWMWVATAQTQQVSLLPWTSCTSWGEWTEMDDDEVQDQQDQQDRQAQDEDVHQLQQLCKDEMAVNHLVKGMCDLWNEERYMLAQVEEDQDVNELAKYANSIHSQLMMLQNQQQQLTNEIDKMVLGEEEKVLQTYTVAAKEVRAEADKWKPAIKEEIDNLLSTNTIIKMSKEEVASLESSGMALEKIPGKLVATRKAPLGRRRARIVACGNFVHGDPLDADSDVAAGGVDGIAIRLLVKLAAEREWCLKSIDVKAAFLQAPKRSVKTRTTLVQPPRLLVELGLAQQGEWWSVQGALYGLVESPKDWSVHRDQELPLLRWSVNGVQYKLVQTEELHLWMVTPVEMTSSWKPGSQGFLATYVDDFLVGAPQEQANAMLEAVQRRLDMQPTRNGHWRPPNEVLWIWDSQGQGRVLSTSMWIPQGRPETTWHGGWHGTSQELVCQLGRRRHWGGANGRSSPSSTSHRGTAVVGYPNPTWRGLSCWCYGTSCPSTSTTCGQAWRWVTEVFECDKFKGFALHEDLSTKTVWSQWWAGHAGVDQQLGGVCGCFARPGARELQVGDWGDTMCWGFSHRMGKWQTAVCYHFNSRKRTGELWRRFPVWRKPCSTPGGDGRWGHQQDPQLRFQKCTSPVHQWHR